MNILIIGSQGMAGHIIATYLKSKRLSVDMLARKNADYEVDLFNLAQVKEIFKGAYRYDYVINCAGLLVKNCNTSLENALFINSYIPKLFETLLADSQTKLIHISTDCVYSGVERATYPPGAVHNAKDNYGISKSLGEINNRKDITFRTSIIGPELKRDGTGLLHWFLTNNDEKIYGWVNHFWNGITTLELAKQIYNYVQNPKVVGIYNLVDSKFVVSKFQLLQSFKETFQRDIIIEPIEHSDPVSKILLNDKQNAYLIVNDFAQQMEELKSYIASSNVYNHYGQIA